MEKMQREEKNGYVLYHNPGGKTIGTATGRVPMQMPRDKSGGHKKDSGARRKAFPAVFFSAMTEKQRFPGSHPFIHILWISISV